MEMLHVAIARLSQRPACLLAAAFRALRGLSAPDAWIWLVRAAAPGGLAVKIIEAGAYAPGPAAPVSLVLLHHMSGLLLPSGAEILRHG